MRKDSPPLPVPATAAANVVTPQQANENTAANDEFSIKMAVSTGLGAANVLPVNPVAGFCYGFTMGLFAANVHLLRKNNLLFTAEGRKTLFINAAASTLNLTNITMNMVPLSLATATLSWLQNRVTMPTYQNSAVSKKTNKFLLGANIVLAGLAGGNLAYNHLNDKPAENSLLQNVREIIKGEANMPSSSLHYKIGNPS